MRRDRGAFIVLGVLALLVPAGCSGGDDAGDRNGVPADDERAFVPEDLSNTELAGQEGGLTLVAFTLEPGPNGLELYAAVKNEGATPACEAGMMVDFYDQADELLTTAGSAVSSGHWYRIEDGSGVVLSCLPPGKVGMAAITELPPAITVDGIARLEHSFPAFAVPGVMPLEGVRVSKLTTVARAEESAYQGTLANGLAQAIRNPKVTVFAVNRVGRPLGVATAEEATEIAAGDTWTFETNGVDELGAGHAVYPGGSVGAP